MAIFSRRSIQRAIDGNAAFIPKKLMRHQILRLNGPDAQKAIAAEWEMVVLYALSKLGIVEYEPGLPSEPRPDVSFRAAAGEAPMFVADVTAISDHGIHDANPLEPLVQELWRRVKERGLDPLRFSLKASGFSSYKGGDKAKLRIPTQERFEEDLFGEPFKNFLSTIEQAPQSPHSIGQSGDDFGVEFGYDPSQRYFSMNHPTFTLPSHGFANPITQRLIDKAKQLARVGFPGTSGVILCDADCDAFRSSPSWQFHSRDELINRFLESQTTVSFVLSLTALRHGPGNYEPWGKLWMKGPMPEQEPVWVEKLRRLVAELPTPVANPKNALGWISSAERGKTGFSHEGGRRVGFGSNRIEVTVSSRVVANLLAGRITPEGFRKTFDRGPAHPNHDPFAKAVEKGMTIQSISLEKDGTETDDDWVKVVFVGPDPAISPFRDPRG